jgi:hypothetical protein
MAEIVGAMEAYDTCFKEDLEPAEVSDLMGQDALGNFRSYVFLDRSASIES